MKSVNSINRNTKFYQGIFTPKNKSKYIGNPDNIIFRSSYELAFMKKLDQRSDVLKWSSEEIFIPYKSPIDNKFHRYFIDFIVVIKDKDNKEVTYAIEVKPYSQTIPPVKKKNVTKRFISESITYEVNQAKWEAAKNYCKEKGWVFQTITEKEIFGKG